LWPTVNSSLLEEPLDGRKCFGDIRVPLLALLLEHHDELADRGGLGVERGN
jgi:hypothetical protein